MDRFAAISWATCLALSGFGLAACAAPPTAIAPGTRVSDDPGGAPTAPAAGSLAGSLPRPIRNVALLLLEPLALTGLVSDGGRIIVSDAGERRWVERLVDAQGRERLAVETTLSGALRVVQRSGVPLSTASGMTLTAGALVVRATSHLAALGIATPSGTPTVDAYAGRQVVSWVRRVSGAPVPGDGVRVVLALDGALVGAAIESSALAAAPSSLRSASAALAAAAKLLPLGATLGGGATLLWVAPAIASGDEEDATQPRRLAWRLRGTLGDGSPFGVDLDAGSLALIGWDWAR